MVDCSLPHQAGVLSVVAVCQVTRVVKSKSSVVRCFSPDKAGVRGLLVRQNLVYDKFRN
jgi:hypothetical protein